MKFLRLTILTFLFLFIFLFCLADETMAAVAYRSSRSTTYASRTNTTITAPAGIQNNDVLIILFGIGASGTPPAPAPPAGFNIITGFPTTETDAGGFKVKTYAWYKIASGESGNYTITHSSAASQGYMAAVSGADIADPFHQNPTTNTGSGTVSTALGLTTPAENSLVMYLGSDWGDSSNALSPPTGTTPTFIERLDPGTVSGIMYVADGVLATQSATGNKTQTNNSAGNPWMASLICINPVVPASAVITGTITTAQEADIVSGGKTITVTLSGDTWAASGAAFDAQRQNIINGLVSSQSETNGWNNEVKAKQGVEGVVRTSDTVVTITLDAEAAYSINAGETITVTVPGSALTGGAQIVASPTFSVSADGVMSNVYYSVGQNADDHKTGSDLEATISNGIATFSYPQTAANMGVGDRVTYNGFTDYVFISRKISDTEWGVVTAQGFMPEDHALTSVQYIAHEYTSLSAAEAGASDNNHLNGTDLTAGNYILNFPCYYDDGPDETPFEIDGWTTSATNYIHIYTPNNTDTEVNQSQRHVGKWDDAKYRISAEPPGTAQDIIRVIEEYVRLDGLQIEHLGVWDQSAALGIRIDTVTSSDIRISNNIIKYTGDPGASDVGISDIYNGGSEIRIWNNIVYDFTNGGISVGYHGASYVYNNTVYGNDGGISCTTAGYATAKNNIAFNNSGEDYWGTFDSSSTNNLSKDATAPALGVYYRNATVYFVDAAGKDFHLSSLGGAAKKAGANLSADTDLAFDDDIDGETRLAVWDIGADQMTDYATINMSLTDKMTNGLIGVWSFDGPDMDWADTTSEAKDRSGNNNHGNVVGATVIPGKHGQGLSFSGGENDDRVDMGDIPNSDSGNKLTVSYWLKPANLAVKQGQISKWNDATSVAGNTWGVRTTNSSSDEIYVFIANSSDAGDNYFTTSNLDLANGQWSHITFVYDGAGLTNADKLKIFKDGAQVSGSFQGTIPSSLNPTASPVAVGLRLVTVTGNTCLDGAMDEVRIYDRALSPSEIGDLYRLGEDRINTSLTNKNTSGLVGMWSFDGPDMNWADTTSEAKDRSGNNNHGDVAGATAAAGKRGQALSFNGSSNYVTIGDVLDFNYNGQFSVSAWIKPNALPGNDSYKCIVSKMDNEAPLSGWYFGLWNSLGQLGLYYDDNSGNQTMATTNEIINTGIWQHVVGVYNNETITIYLNGVPQSNSETATAATSSVNNNVPLCIGCDDNATDEIFDGAIDEVRVYSRALSPAEIGDLYHMGQATLVAPKRQCFQTWFDDFSGSWPGNWRGDTAKFVITDGELEENLGPDDLGSVYYNSPVNSAAQYCKFTNAAEGYPFNDRSGCIFRATGENGYRYAVWIDNDGDLAWDRYNGSTYVDTIDGVGMSKNNGDTFGITVQGAGTGTVVKVWRNPSGDVPFDKNNWKSINDPAEATLTDGSSKLAAAPADLGTYVGAHMSLDSIEGNSRLIMDDMFGGWCR